MFSVISAFGRQGQKAKMKAIGLMLFSLYILTSYIANDVLSIPSIFNSYALMAFLGYTILYIILNTREVIINEVFSWLLVFFSLTCFTYIYSPDTFGFNNEHIFIFIVNVTLVLFIIQYKLTVDDIKFLSWIYLISGVLLMIILYQTGYLSDITIRLGDEVMGNANAFAVLLMFSSMLGFWLFVNESGNIVKKITIIICISLIYYGMFLSGGRKYIIVPLVFLYILMLTKRNKHGRTKIIRSTVIIIVLIAIVFYLMMNIPVFYDMIGVRMEGLFALFTGSVNTDGSTDIRERMIYIGIEGFQDRPLCGHGANSFKYYNRDITGNFYYSHNNFVELLYNYGIIGFVLFYSFYFRLIKKAWKRRYELPQSSFGYVMALIPSILLFEVGAVSYIFKQIFFLLYFALVLVNQKIVSSNCKM